MDSTDDSSSVFDDDSVYDGSDSFYDDDDDEGEFADLLEATMASRSKVALNSQYGTMTTEEVTNLLDQLRFKGEDSSETSKQRQDIVSIEKKITKSMKIVSEDSIVKTETNAPHPKKILKVLLSSNGYKMDSIKFANVPSDFFLKMTAENIAAYTKDLIKAIRTKDLDALKNYLSEGKTLQCCNKFGESSISLVCRNQLTEVLTFLLEKAKVSIQICDDYGRTPLHDACWVSDPDFTLILTLLNKCPDLLLLCDKRGHTPLDYVRKEHYDRWNTFLRQNEDKILPSVLGTRD